jgi:hypothetical protein
MSVKWTVLLNVETVIHFVITVNFTSTQKNSEEEL